MTYTPLTKNIIKAIRSLEHRKFRRETGLFLAEGNKLVGDLMGRMHCHRLVATEGWWSNHGDCVALCDEAHVMADSEVARISLLQSPQDVLGTFYVPQVEPLDADVARRTLVVALDAVQDPGNVGTIIRLCDWFGVRDIVASTDTADCYSPKVVQASMGALARVRVHYTNLSEWLGRLWADTPVYGTFLDGHNIYSENLASTGVVVMGNEGRGISPNVEACVTRRLTIPSYPAGDATSESLNVGVATAIAIAEFRRQASC